MMKLFLRGWKIAVAFFLTTSLMLLFCAGNLSNDTPKCFNFNVFSFWNNAQNPSLICLNESCSDAPFRLGRAPEMQSAKNEAQSSERNDAKTKDVIDTPPTYIHLSVVACGDRLEETLVMIKSAVLISEQRIHVHIFADDDLRPKFREELRKWPSPIRKNFITTIYPITYPEGTNVAEWVKLFKQCATQRLFIPYVVPENVTDKIIYVDTDILFMRPLEHIWNFFSRFNSTHIAALAPEHEWDRQGWYNRFARHPYYGERGVNSGVMLMNIAKMRELDWVDRMIEYHKEYKLRITWGDQDLINIFFHYYPEKLYVYPCHWNFRPDHCMYGLNCEQAKKRGVSIIHGNRGVYHNEKQLVFKAIYNVIKDAKFDKDLKTQYLNPLKKAIKSEEKAGYCGKIGETFTMQLERQLKLKSEKCKDNPACDPYEAEDFELEGKLKVNGNEGKEYHPPNRNIKPAKESQNESQNKKTEAKTVSQSDKSNESQNPKVSKEEEEKEEEKYELNESVFEYMTTGLLKKFPDIKKTKLLPVLTEHFTRLKDARERSKQVVRNPPENVDTALLAPALHEEILGYAQEHTRIKRAEDYLKALNAVIERLKLEKDHLKSQDKSKDTSKDSMHLVVVACGELLEQPLVMMKSAVLFSRNFLNIHVFADDHLQPQFKSALEAWPENLQTKFKLHIHDITYPKQNAAEWRKLFKTCATQRLFLPDVMPDVDSVIYVDADILFLRPIDDLWNLFKKFNSTHISALAPEHEDAHVSWYKRFARHPYYPPLGVNSGVMPMNLTRMREAKWLEYIVPYFHKYRYNTTWGDQDLINIFFHFFPEKLKIFPCDLNYRQDHCMYMHVCKRAEDLGVSILHGARGVYQNEKEMAFRAVYEALRDYQFGTDMKTNLLSKMRENISKHEDTNCGKVGWVLTKQLEKQLNKREAEKVDNNKI